MNENLVKTIACAIEKMVAGIEEKRSLDKKLAELMQREVNPHTTPERCYVREYTDIMKQIKNIEMKTVMNIGPDMDALKKTAVYITCPIGERISDRNTQADIWLLEKGFIYTAGELANMRSRHANPVNPAMLRVIERYAKEHFSKEAKKFEFEIEDAGKYIRAADAMVQLAKEAFEDTSGAAAATLDSFISLETGKVEAERFIEWANEQKSA